MLVGTRKPLVPWMRGAQRLLIFYYWTFPLWGIVVSLLDEAQITPPGSLVKRMLWIAATLCAANFILIVANWVVNQGIRYDRKGGELQICGGPGASKVLKRIPWEELCLVVPSAERQPSSIDTPLVYVVLIVTKRGRFIRVGPRLDTIEEASQMAREVGELLKLDVADCEENEIVTNVNTNSEPPRIDKKEYKSRHSCLSVLFACQIMIVIPCTLGALEQY